MITRDSILLILLAAVLIAGGAWWFLRGPRTSNVTPAQPIPTVDEDVKVRLHKIRLHGVSKGKVVWELEADNVDVDKDRPILHIQGLRQAAMVEDGKAEISVSAQTMEQNVASGDITLSGAVEVSGNKVLMRTSSVVWQAQVGTLRFPQQLSTQFGDFTLSVGGTTLFDARSSLLNCTGPVMLSTKGSVIRASGARVDVTKQTFTLSGPVHAELDVASMEEWAEGRNIPQIPAIPPGVQRRYQEYLQRQHRLPSYNPFGGNSNPFSRKGTRP